MGHFQVIRQGIDIHRKTVVLAGDHHRVIRQGFHRVVGAVVARGHFHGLGATGQCQQLMAQADTEHRQPGGNDLLDRGNGIVARLRVTGAVGQEDTVRLHGQHLGRGRLGWHHGELAATLGQHAQDVALDAVVVGHHMEAGLALLGVTFLKIPGGLGPAVGLGNTHFLRQVHAFQAGEPLGRRQRLCFIHIVAGQNATILGTLVTQNACQAASVDIGDGNDVALTQVVRKSLLTTPVAHCHGQITNHQA